MKLSIGIVGLPNVGKSTLFQLLTKKQVNIANYPFSTVSPNVGVVAIKNEQLDKIAKAMKSKRIFPAALEFVDIAGLVAGAHEGRGLGNQFLAQIREADAIIHLIRTFKDEEVVHFEGIIDPLKDFEAVQEELKLKDLESKEQKNLLSSKPQLIIINGENEIRFAQPHLVFNLKEGLKEENLQAIFKSLYQLLNLITFYTANENEARSWLIKNRMDVVSAAGVIHTDFEEKFIKAEVISWHKLAEAGDWHKARNKGWIRLEGRDYIVQDGDVILIKHGR